MKILVIDDEAELRHLYERVLKRAGYETATAASGAEALPKFAEDWDIVLTDLSMPGSINGIEILLQARKLTSADVILMTAYPEMNTAVEAMRDGAYDYLIKPFNLDALLVTIARCLDKRRLSAELAREKALRAQLEKAHGEMLRLEKVKETFGQFASPEVVKLVLERPDEFLERGERRVVSVMFADVKSFTPFASRVAPEEVVATLNEIFEIAVEEINAEGGILNKFVGDGLMAVFGAPVPLEDHAAAAARAALKAGRRFEELSRRRVAEGREPIKVCLGINTGEVVAGCLGTKQRKEYGIVGSAVSLASRLEGANRFFGSRIIFRDGAQQLAKEGVEARTLGRMRIAGVGEPLTVYELLGLKGALQDAWREALPLYDSALEHFSARRYAEAAAAFRGVLALVPEDGPSTLYLESCERYAAAPPPENWDRVISLSAK